VPEARRLVARSTNASLLLVCSRVSLIGQVLISSGALKGALTGFDLASHCGFQPTLALVQTVYGISI